MHAHSLWSYDGCHSLADIARIYGRLGADVVMMSEHDTGFDPSRFSEYRSACAKASTDTCQLVPGIEYSSPDNDIHILTWGMETFLGEHRPIMQTLSAVRASGGVAILAHPIRRSAYLKVDPAWFEFLSGIELWNRKSDGISWGHEALMLLQQTGLPAFVGHDFHRYRQIWPLYQAFTTAAPLDKDLEAILVTKIKSGNCSPYAFGRPLDVNRTTPGLSLFPLLERARKKIRSR